MPELVALGDDVLGMGDESVFRERSGMVSSMKRLEQVSEIQRDDP